MRLATLEGSSIPLPRRSRRFPHSAAMSAFAGYGEEPETLGGIKSFVKRTARKTGNVVSDIARPVGGVVQDSLRAVGQAEIPVLSSAANAAVGVGGIIDKSSSALSDLVQGSSGSSGSSGAPGTPLTEEQKNALAFLRNREKGLFGLPKFGKSKSTVSPVVLFGGLGLLGWFLLRKKRGN